MRRVGRNRTKFTSIPVGWDVKRSGVYFRPTNQNDREIVKSITGGPLSLRLGRDHAEAFASPLWLRVLAARKQQIEGAPVAGHVSELIERARRSFLPRIANPETRGWRARHIDELEREFGSRRYARNVYDATKAAAGTYITTLDIQQFIDRHRDSRPVAANRAVQTWRQVWAEAKRRWGLTEYNPCHGIEANPESPREVLPDDQDHFFRVYRKLDPPARFILALARYYGRRRGEALRIELSGVRTDGLHTVRGKKARELVLAWDDLEIVLPTGQRITRPGRLRKMVSRVMRWRESIIRPRRVLRNGHPVQTPRVVSTKLLINRRGAAVTASGFTSAFRRAMERCGLVEELGEQILGGRKVQRTRRAFNPHDLRAKRASTLPLDQAAHVLAHDDPRTTETVYRRGPKVINLRGRK